MHDIEERVLFFHAVGEALAQWAYVENQLWLLTSGAFPVHQRSVIFEGLMAIESFRARLSVCDKYLRSNFTDPIFVKRWQAAHQLLERLSRKRNKVAHWVPVSYFGAPEGRRYALENWHPDVLTSGGRPSSEALCVQQLELLRREFHQLTTDLASLNSLVSIGRPLLETFNVEHTRKHSLRRIRMSAFMGFRLQRQDEAAMIQDTQASGNSEGAA